MKHKTPKIGADARAQIAQALPVAMEKAICAYQSFINNGDDNDLSNEYKNKQAAAKAGLAHIELLLKLAGIVDDSTEDNFDDVEMLLAKAQQELKGLNE